MARREWRVRAGMVDPRTGKRKEVQRRVNGSFADAVKARQVLMGDLAAGRAVEAPRLERLTLSVFARSWLEQRSVRVRPSTLARYAEALDLHVLPELGDYYIDALTTEDVETWLARAAMKRHDAARAGARRKRKQGDPAHKPVLRRVSPATVNGWLRTFKTVLKAAARLTGRDIGAPVAPLPEAPAREGLTLSETRKLLAAAADDICTQSVMLHILIFTGMRFSECAALRWEDIDEETGTIHVRRNHRRGKILPTKNNRVRRLPLVPELRPLLKAHRKQLLEEQDPGMAEGWCFATTTRTGGLIRLRVQSTMRKRLDKWQKAGGLARHVTPQDIRRTWVDLSRQAKVDVVVRHAIVGHSGDDVHGQYSTVRDEEVAEGAQAVVRLVKGGGA